MLSVSRFDKLGNVVPEMQIQAHAHSEPVLIRMVRSPYVGFRVPVEAALQISVPEFDITGEQARC